MPCYTVCNRWQMKATRQLLRTRSSSLTSGEAYATAACIAVGAHNARFTAQRSSEYLTSSSPTPSIHSPGADVAG